MQILTKERNRSWNIYLGANALLRKLEKLKVPINIRIIIEFTDKLIWKKLHHLNLYYKLIKYIFFFQNLQTHVLRNLILLRVTTGCLDIFHVWIFTSQFRLTRRVRIISDCENIVFQQNYYILFIRILFLGPDTQCKIAFSRLYSGLKKCRKITKKWHKKWHILGRFEGLIS